MRVLRLVPVLLFAAMLHLPASAIPACADGPIRISEFVAGPAQDWDGSGAFSSRDDEWVEIVNDGATSVTLDGWFLTDADSVRRFAFTGSLAPGQRRVVFGSTAVAWERANGYSVVGLSLSNSGDQVILWHQVGADSIVADRYAYRSHEAAADRAVGRLAPGGEWSLFDGLNPYTGTLLPAGNGCAPTPNAPNVCVSTPAERTSWGSLKSRYR